MQSFQLTIARTADEAMRALAADTSARLIAGGTTLADLMKLDVERPAHLIDISRLGRSDPMLGRVSRLADGTLRIGALARNSDVAEDALIRTAFPLLSQALLAGASGQIRNMATTAGNLLQRTRCWYFRDTAMPCNKREPGTGCSAIGGVARMHAVLGTSTMCIATHPSDMCVALAALDATVRIRGPEGERSVSFADFHTLPGDHPEVENVLRAGELVTAIDLAALPMARRSAYTKVRDRASYAFALASAAVALDVADGKVRAARIALGGVGTKPWRATAAERVLVGATAGETAWRAAADAALADAATQPGNAFKVRLARGTIVRTLRTVAALT